MKSLTQKVLVKAEVSSVFNEVVKWQDAQWWPDIAMKFTRISNGSKPMYLQEAKVPFGPKWRTRVSLIDRERNYLKRDFIDGIFAGGYEEMFLCR